MKRVSMLLIGGMKDSKAVTIIKDLKNDLSKKGIAADIQFVNSYKVNDLSKYEDNIDGIITVGVTKIQTKLPVINGLGLLYEWLGKNELYEGIEKISYNKE
jgi:hypothetical protein